MLLFDRAARFPDRYRVLYQKQYAAGVLLATRVEGAVLEAKRVKSTSQCLPVTP